MSADLRAPHLGVGGAFLSEVCAQRAAALDELERAATSQDEWSLSAARGRLRDLEELLDRNDWTLPVFAEVPEVPDTVDHLDTALPPGAIRRA